MHPRIISSQNEHLGEECDTLFYQGNGSSQTQALKYIGEQKIMATTGQMMWCTGRNNLLPLNVIYKLHIGTEIADVNLQPFKNYTSFFNPFKLLASVITWASNWNNGFHFTPTLKFNAESVKFHTPIISEVSIGQVTDMLSHRKKYDNWLEKKDKTNGLILWGVSRGTAATFCAFSKEKYPEVKLVVLEGAIDSVHEVLPKRISNTIQSKWIAEQVTRLIVSSFSFFNKCGIMQYYSDGPSPLKSVADFPPDIPVVFITSKADMVVSCSNTEKIASALAAKGQNDVYLLKLERSSHPNYMFDDPEDRKCYETFIHAIYKKYNLKHDINLALEGENLLTISALYTKELENDETKMSDYPLSNSM